jgi:hypothetical protein
VSPDLVDAEDLRDVRWLSDASVFASRSKRRNALVVREVLGQHLDREPRGRASCRARARQTSPIAPAPTGPEIA